MPRTNDKPVKCWHNYNEQKTNCRFLTKQPAGWYCVRNPKWVEPAGNHECFAGEPIIDRSCKNCGKIDDCWMYEQTKYHTIDREFRRPGKPRWHCSDWKERMFL